MIRCVFCTLRSAFLLWTPCTDGHAFCCSLLFLSLRRCCCTTSTGCCARRWLRRSTCSASLCRWGNRCRRSTLCACSATGGSAASPRWLSASGEALAFLAAWLKLHSLTYVWGYAREKSYVDEVTTFCIDLKIHWMRYSQAHLSCCILHCATLCCACDTASAASLG